MLLPVLLATDPEIRVPQLLLIFVTEDARDEAWVVVGRHMPARHCVSQAIAGVSDGGVLEER